MSKLETGGDYVHYSREEASTFIIANEYSKNMVEFTNVTVNLTAALVSGDPKIPAITLMARVNAMIYHEEIGSI